MINPKTRMIILKTENHPSPFFDDFGLAGVFFFSGRGARAVEQGQVGLRGNELCSNELGLVLFT